MQRHHAVATCRIGKGLRVVTAFGVGLAVPFVAVAGSGLHSFGNRLVHRQVQRHYAVAARRVGERLSVVAA